MHYQKQYLIEKPEEKYYMPSLMESVGAQASIQSLKKLTPLDMDEKYDLEKKYLGKFYDRNDHYKLNGQEKVKIMDTYNGDIPRYVLACQSSNKEISLDYNKSNNLGKQMKMNSSIQHMYHGYPL